ncbi:hypothetical protein EJ05DRAFT_513680 [Pseudovirgaria hyperparasitica]|uniref:Uncharacterized protein n=1 Tax=Pseudovirgaria hyperparasitica TaxID=470096 RepID=A0A6A6VYK3_9PEZI|nr:uncharacterized protein EJ05DRAFT_513680 [Pseudovirgaria hyperparasitica]KAF2754750.1 hypothetical protein EJ05DRAFT_513680 [Pseudovirgaria hyperparasitica]
MNKRHPAASATREMFLSAVGLRTSDKSDMVTYNIMLAEAAAGRDRLSQGIARPTWDSIPETDKYNQIAIIFERSDPYVRYYYQIGAYEDGPNKENWVIRWLLWHSFRYRDNRNRKGQASAVPSVYWDPVRDV